MREIVPTKVIAATLGLAGFAVALLAGLAVDNPAPDILVRAMIAMAACSLIGMGISAVSARIVADHLRKVGAVATAPRAQPPSATGAPSASAVASGASA